MNNRQTIKIKERQTGTFSLITNTILYHKDLTAFDKLLLVSILSDDDSYTFNITTYANRLNCSTDKISRSISRLKKAGFIKQKKLQKRFNGWYYVISEYGNLENDSIALPSTENHLNENKDTKQEIPTLPKENTHVPSIENEVNVLDLNLYADLICAEFDKAIESGLNIDEVKYIEYLNTACTDGRLSSVSQMTSENLNAILIKLAIKLTDKDVEKMVDKKSDNLSIKDTASLKIIMKDWLKDNPNATEKLLSQETLKKKNKFRKPISGYND